MNPLLIDIPIPITTPRLLLRPPQPGDGASVNAAIIESFAELNKWLSWADHKPTVEETEMEMRKAAARFILREDLPMLIFDRNTHEFLGGTGLHRMNWQVPKFEIGYWVRTSQAGNGIITESTNALAQYAFRQLKAARVEIKVDETNTASRRIAEKLHFKQEGILINEGLQANSSLLRNTVIYARYDDKGLPTLDVSW